MEFFRISGREVAQGAIVKWLVMIAISAFPAARSPAQDATHDLFLPGTGTYESLSENGRRLFDGLTNNRQADVGAVIVRMRSIEKVLSNDKISFIIPGREERIEILVKNIQYSDEQNYKVYGTVGESLLSVILTSRDGMKGGLIQGIERSYEICDLGEDGQLLLTHEADADGKDFCGLGIGSTAKPSIEPDPGKNGRMPGDNAKVEPCTNGIRVLFVYPNNVSPVSATNHANNIIDVFNQTVINSGVAGTALIEKAAIVPTTYIPASGKITEEALKLSNDVNLQNLRNQHKADMVLLFSWADYDGYGGVPDPETYLHPLNARAYTVVSMLGPNIPVIGAHELSHLFGCNHDNDNIGLPYSKGYVFSTLNNLVARGTAPGTKIIYYSNPNKSFNGSVMGDATHNNAKVMNEKAATVKAFRAEPNVLNGWINGPYSGLEYQVYTYEAISRCGNPPYTYKWQESTDGINYSGNGTGEFHNVGLYHNGNHLFYLKLKITSSDGQVAENWMQIWVDDQPGDNYRAGEKGDGSFKYDNDVLYPNPVSDHVKFVFEATGKTRLKVGLTDLNGRKGMPETFFQCSEGRNDIDLDLSGQSLAPGIYLLTLDDGAKVRRKKLLFQPATKP